MKLTKEDISTWNSSERYSSGYNFSIQKLSQAKFSDDKAVILEEYLESKGISSDIFNVEYMGHLTGKVYCDKETLIFHINNFLSKK